MDDDNVLFRKCRRDSLFHQLGQGVQPHREHPVEKREMGEGDIMSSDLLRQYDMQWSNLPQEMEKWQDYNDKIFNIETSQNS